MHIPDNYLSPSTCAVAAAAMLPVWKKAAAKVKKEITRKKLPLLGTGAAFSFLIMMFNLPLPGGTTGHAVGATLIAILLGPYSAIIATTIALAIQALFFGDGGLLAFGVNAFNMAFIMPVTGYYIYRLIRGGSESPKRSYMAAFIAAYVSLNVAALLTAVEFGIQPLLFKDAAGMPLYCPYPLGISIPAMLIPHLVVAGFVEAVVTAGVLAYVKKLSPELLYTGSTTRVKPLYALIGALVILCPIGLLASGTAWGEWTAEDLRQLIGYVPPAMKHGFSFGTILPDYTVFGLPEAASYIISAIAGVLLIFVAIKLIGFTITKLKPEKTIE